MAWHATWEDPFATDLSRFTRLMGDARTWTTFTETVSGSSAAGALVCQRRATHAPLLATTQQGAQRVMRMVTGDRTNRAPHLDADQLLATLRRQAVEPVERAPAAEVWRSAAGAAWRTPHAHAMPHRMRVTTRAGGLVHGDRTLKVIGSTPNRRGVF